MKKTLALLLAMLMILSVALISCGKKDEEETADSSDDLGFVFDAGSNASGDGSGDGESGESEDNSGFAPIVENKEAYALMSAYVRKSHKKSATNGKVIYGDKVTRIETDGTWTKIKYTDDDAQKEGYVRNELLTTDKGRVDYTIKETPVKATSNSDKVSVRQAPWTGSENYPTLIKEITGTDGESYKLKKDQAVEIIAETNSKDDSGNTWAWISYTVNGKLVQGWCRMDCLTTGETTDTPAADPSNPGIVKPDPV